MTSKAIVKCNRKWRSLALGALALVLWQAAPASAADEPDLIFRAEKARAEIKDYVDKLGPSLKDIGKKALARLHAPR